ncbi:CHAT domain-containing protein [Sorangium sp. So ce119]|uniref:CHAT domain-containing protein n=1 Tax=Sorangium sp. So ce119 TaxID=3133279 RepID=UPI003F635F55
MPCRPRLAASWLLVLLLLLSQGGCLVFTSRASLRQARYLAYEATSVRSHDVSAQVERVLLNDLKKPIFDDARYQADLRIFAIRIAARHAGKDPRSAPDGFTADRVELYYRQGQALTERLGEQWVQLVQARALYFNAAGQSGVAERALQELKRALLQHRVEEGDFFGITTDDALATVYEDMGRLDQRDQARTRALDAARIYFAQGGHADEEYRAYHDLLLHRMADLTRGPPDQETAVAPAAVLRLWETARPLADDYVPLPVRHLSYYRSAEYLAEAGDPRRGLAIIQEWQDDLEEHRGTRALDAAAALEATCFLGRVHLAMGDAGKAQSYLESCLKSLDGVEHREPLLHQALGLAYERQGAFDKAEAEYRKDEADIERLRKSYSLEQRAAFFNSRVRGSYWGLIRSAILQNEGRALDDATCGKLLAYSELIRARQLVELAEERRCGGSAPAEEPAGRIDLARLRRGLPGGALLLDYVATGRDLLALVAVSETQCRGQLIRLSAGFTSRLKKLNEELGHPIRPLDVLELELGEVGRQVLGPVRDLMEGKRELVVLPDGPLNLVPFDLLSLAPRRARYRALIEEHVVRLWPSLRAPPCLQRPGQREEQRLLAVADPCYTGRFQRLGDTLSEVRSIAELFPGDAYVLKQDMALRSTLREGDWRAYTHVHLATHGSLGGRDLQIGPNEPALVLSREPADAPTDSYLTAGEASHLKLDADLTVLSACETGSGRYETGEGVLGLGRAFLIAGSRQVLMSLWKVDSRATELLMKAFYRHLLRDKEDPAVALRNAKLDLRAQSWDVSPAPFEPTTCSADTASTRKAGTRSSAPATPGPRYPLAHPAYWAGFVLLGTPDLP